MDVRCRSILEEFDNNIEVFKKMQKTVLDFLEKSFDETGVIPEGLESRIKDRNSLAEKLERKGDKYESMTDVTDLLGVRVITYYTTDISKVAALVEKEFEIDWDNSVDKRKSLASDQMGYMSIHYICRIPKSMHTDETCPKLNEYRFEIQLRTALQHVWATVNHDTGYKSEIEVPKIYIRQITRLAGLLEIADEEFAKIIGEITDYRRRVESLVESGNFDELSLDGDSFNSYIRIGPFDSLNEKIAAINKAEIRDVSLFPFYEVFVKLGFSTIGDIERMKEKLFDKAYQFMRIQIGATDIDIVASNVGIRALCIVWILDNGGDKNDLVEFLDILNGGKTSNESTAERILKIAKKAHIRERD
ncbi:MAG: (p)ppGpp synthetase [Lachnospiraceae bacterium]|jgi:ppGpp synthetase/RelA/SpoT-type nucleotidyltranferase|nr:(p)ppGpp synthetase [Lachnospiraceae bacterium]